MDKLESFPGYRTELSAEEFFEQVRRIGISVVGQSGGLAPADKKLYALRDVTATVDSIPLITSSIMGKKLASGSRSIVLDVKCGSGSFMKTEEDAFILAKNMTDIGKMAGRNMTAVITDMDIPLGHAIGNSLEVIEAIEVLSGGGPRDLRSVCIALATEMTSLSLGYSEQEARAAVIRAIESGEAKKKLAEWIGAQGGDARYVEDTSLFRVADHARDVYAEADGYITHIDTESVGLSSVLLGAGRIKKDDVIDHSAGIILHKKTGDRVSRGERIATLYSCREASFGEAEALLCRAYGISDTQPEPRCAVRRIIR